MGGSNTTHQFIVAAIFMNIRATFYARAQQRNACFSCEAVVAGTAINCEHALGPRNRHYLA